MDYDGSNDIGDSKCWLGNLAYLGNIGLVNVVIDNIPSANAIAWWDAPTPSTNGLVGVVENFNPGDCSLEISTCNWDCANFSAYGVITTLPNAFIHLGNGYTPNISARNNQLNLDLGTEPLGNGHTYVQYGLYHEKIMIRNNGGIDYMQLPVSVVLKNGIHSFTVFEDIVDLGKNTYNTCLNHSPTPSSAILEFDYFFDEPPVGNYEIIVFATITNPDGSTSVIPFNTFCNKTYSLTIEDNLLAANSYPQLLYPGVLCSSVAGQPRPVVNTVIPLFRFRAVANATGYTAEIINETTGNTSIVQLGTPNPPVFLPNAPLQNNCDYRWKITAHFSNNVDRVSSEFCFKILSEDILPADCSVDDLLIDNEALMAIQYLCSLRVVTPYSAQGLPLTVFPDEEIFKVDLAEYITLSLFGGGNPQNLLVDKYPVPFLDVSEIAPLLNLRNVVFLTYLYYDSDPKRNTPFEDSYFNFYPFEHPTLEDVLRAILEGFNLPVNQSLPNPYFSYAMGNGILSAADTWYVPGDNAKRWHVFKLLYRVLSNPSITKPSLNDFINPANFFAPGHYTPKTLFLHPGLSDGSFSFNLGTFFPIANNTMPLSVSIYYDSEATVLPDAYYRCLDFGTKGWNHDLCSYGHIIDGWNYSQFNVDDHFVLFMPGSSFPTVWSIDNVNLALANFTPVTQGINLDIQYSNGNIIVTSLTKVRYTFSNPVGMNDLFVLTEIKDLKNPSNFLTLSYTGDLLRKVEASGSNRAIEFIRNGSHRIIEIRETINGAINNNRKITFFYDVFGRLSSFNDLPYNGTPVTTQYQYLSNNVSSHILLISKITFPEGNTVDNSYYKRRLNSSSSLNSSGTASFETNIDRQFNFLTGYFNSEIKNLSSGQVLNESSSNRNANGYPTHQTQTQNDNNGAYTVTTNFDYSASTFPGLPSKSVHNNIVAEYKYNSKGQTTELKIPGYNIHHKVTYSSDNFPISSSVFCDGVWQNNSFQYSNGSWGNLIRLTDAENGVTNISYSNKGMPTHIEGPTNVNNYIRYTPDGLPYEFEDQLQNIIRAQYNGVGTMTKIWFPNSQPNEFYELQYYENDLPKKAIKPDLTYTESEYTKNGMQKRFRTSSGKYYNYTYTDKDLIENVTYPDQTYEHFTWYDDGRLNTYTDRSGIDFIHTYYPDGSLKEDGFFRYYYGARKNLQKIEEMANTSSFISFSHDAIDRLTSYHTEVAKPNGGTHEFDLSYDLNENASRIKMHLPGNKDVSYRYNKKNELVGLDDVLGQTYEVTRRADGMIDRIKFPNNTEQRRTYNAAGMLVSLTWVKLPSNQVIYNENITYDPNRNIVSRTFDQSHQIPLADEVDYEFTIDLDNNELVSVEDLLTNNTASFAYDANGNMTSNPKFTNITWDISNRLSGLQSSSFNSSYSWLPGGQIAYSVTNGIERGYVIDISGLGEVVAETDANGNVLYYYTYIDGVLASRIDANTQVVRYYHTNYRGDVVEITDGQQNATHRYTYLADGETFVTFEADYNPYRFLGGYGVAHVYDNVYNVRARFYDADYKIFYSEDPIWNENAYQYANRNPFTNFDPSGAISISAIVHTSLDVVGLVPGIGEIADGVNALIYLAEGDVTNAALSASAMIPGLGAAATVAKHADEIISVGRTIVNSGVIQTTLKNPKVFGYIGTATKNGANYLKKKASAVIGAHKTGGNVVYLSVEAGVTQYVGITNNLARRAAEHLRIKRINIEPLMQGLTKSDARAVEQALIKIHGLGKEGGTLLNKINSISPTNPAYGSQLQRGYELLKSIGYH
jgi:RHS repeat-associated protein